MSKFIMIKAKNSLPSLKFLEESYNTKGEERHFNVTGSGSDKAAVRGLSDDSYPVYILVFSEIGAEQKVEYLYLGSGTKCGSERSLSLRVSILQKVLNQSVIENFLSCSEIDLTQDFDYASYISVENSPSLVKQMNFITYPLYKNTEILQIDTYTVVDEEKSLHSLAQRNEYCIREYASVRAEYNRGEFQRDYERIVHSKAFRRMVDKAQIFSAEKGDHYRTRMTHSIVVSQIAKGISNALKLNNFLTDAIALGHDMGHTPFGHQGERTLNAVLTGEKPLLKSVIEEGATYGGFKHNYHSLRVATRLEEKYIEFDGLNLSFQTLDGIWKHTKTNLPNNPLINFVSSSTLHAYLNSEPIPRTPDGQVVPYTLEGQVVRVADEIAQRSHDLEDAFSAKRLTVEELKNYLLLGKMHELKTQIEQIEEGFIEAKKSNHFGADDDELLQERISSRIIYYFINDVLTQSNTNIDSYLLADGKSKFEKNGHKVDKLLIEFSLKGKNLCDYLEKIISKKVINSGEVSLFDSNGAAVIESLFASYYNNPRLLHRGTLRRIMQDFRKITKNVVDFEEGDPLIIEKEWRKIINAKANKEDRDLEENEYFLKNRVLVRNITDFIAGMTDSYAINEYNNIRR
ncbi:deoxyguanosinetriphosphate triphosphohydrolase family protein [Sporomusa sphaeroides]|uniref:Deoxyguanosinetriphosphate triphosphohydrolase n=1 Tax=Sporomusa sphaeroides DSM 2875 TaxID=1337886 RepID=A0ABP2CAW1_9FIRM|nr:dNTP triphosphohydrolase [Sporomusa sphaeroides]OLS57645.1 deoxyguanosinetriphosphate triphosphohydrolase [Sporomusa sphaeroides DSM 2875]CVK21330.1 Deoxyguanosinetriphosphate triphosphohydrolase [Sporomusa sphaeroides DSM 2875]